MGGIICLSVLRVIGSDLSQKVTSAFKSESRSFKKKKKSPRERGSPALRLPAASQLEKGSSKQNANKQIMCPK